VSINFIEQFVWSSHFYNFSGLQNDNNVIVVDGVNSMGYGKNGCVVHLAHVLLYHSVCVLVHVSGGFVQKLNLTVTDQRPAQREQLSLTRAQILAILFAEKV